MVRVAQEDVLNATLLSLTPLPPPSLSLSLSLSRLKEEGVPLFFVLMIAEWLFIAIRRKVRGETCDPPSAPRYRLGESLVCIMLGSIEQLFVVFVHTATYFLDVSLYRYVYTHWRAQTIEPKEHVYLTYFGLLLGKDLCYYCAHRFLHEYHIGWFSHSVHHSGEDYNLATGLRQGITQPFITVVFYLPLALCGFHPVAFAAHAQLNTLYMFWIHTDLVDRLPFGLEYIFNSPMAHRMHHRPPAHCNYGGMFVIWDRIFGTYKVELDRKDLYGLAKAPQTFDPLTLNTQHFARLQKINKPFSQWLCARRVRAKWVCDVRLLFARIPPAGRDLRAKAARVKWDGASKVPLSCAGAAGLFALGVSATATAFGLLVMAPTMTRVDRAIGIIVALALFRTVCLVCDFRPGQWRCALISALALLPALIAIIVLQPAKAWDAAAVTTNRGEL